MAKKKDSKKSKKIKIELTPSSTFLWSIFLLFLLTWVFVLGIFVGRGALPGAISGLGNPLKKLREVVSQKEKYDYNKPEEDHQEFVFYDKLESKKNEVKNNHLPPREKNPPSREVTLSRDETVEVPGKQQLHEAGKVEVPETLQENVTTREFFSVQLASISDSERAEKLIKELVDQGYDAYYYIATVKGKKICRIMCGRFTSRDDALEYLKKLEKNTDYRGFVSKVGNK